MVRSGHRLGVIAGVVLGGVLAVALPTAGKAEGPAASSSFAEAGTEAGPAADALIAAARGQVGQTVLYDPAYVRLDFPQGDVARDRGVCTDVVIRALRDGAQIDLQRAVNRDMKESFSSYPANWGLKRPDPNIDHRRVPNLITLLSRVGAKLPADADYQPGDIVTSMLPGNLPHIMIVSDRAVAGQPLVIHNIGAGAREEDALTRYPVTGHFRLSAEALTKLRKLDQ